MSVGLAGFLSRQHGGELRNTPADAGKPPTPRHYDDKGGCQALTFSAPSSRAFFRSSFLGVRRAPSPAASSFPGAGLCLSCCSLPPSRVCLPRVLPRVLWRCPSPVVTTPRAIGKPLRCHPAPQWAKPSRREASGSELGGRRSRPRFGRCSCCWTGFPGTRAQVGNGAWVKPRRSLPSGEVRALVPTCRPGVASAGGRLAVPCRSRPLSLRAALNHAGGATARPPSPPPPSAPRLRRARPRPSAHRCAFPFSGKTGPVFRGRGHRCPHPRECRK